MSAVTLLVLLATVPAVANSAPRQPPQTPLQRGNALYRQYCEQCHALLGCLCAGFGIASCWITAGFSCEISIPESVALKLCGDATSSVPSVVAVTVCASPSAPTTASSSPG